jgi:hypothetical protein
VIDNFQIALYVNHHYVYVHSDVPAEDPAFPGKRLLDVYETGGIFEWFTGISYRFGRNWSAGFEFWKHHEFADATVHEHSAYFVGPRIHMETRAGGPRSASSTSC